MTQDEQDEIAHDQITKQVSASRHTPEPWKVSANLNHPLVTTGRYSVAVCHATNFVDRPTAESNAARIASCVNFLAGVPIEKLTPENAIKIKEILAC